MLTGQFLADVFLDLVNETLVAGIDALRPFLCNLVGILAGGGGKTNPVFLSELGRFRLDNQPVESAPLAFVGTLSEINFVRALQIDELKPLKGLRHLIGFPFAALSLAGRDTI